MKTELINEYKQVLNTMRKGTFAVKQRYSEIMRALVNDMALLNCLPRTFSNLNAKILKKLVEYWIEQKNSPKTIANKLSILRGYCRLAKIQLAIPANKLLGVRVTPSNNNHRISVKEILNNVRHPIVKSIVECQAEFGLNKSESIKLTVDTQNQEKLMIHRNFAYNHQDRFIPVVSCSQKAAVVNRFQLLQGKTRLTDVAEHKWLLNLYQADLRIAGFIKQPNFRKHYSKKRFELLLQSTTANYAYEILSVELGINSLWKIKRMIHE